MKSNISPEYLIEYRKFIGTWIRELREYKGLTQEKLGELCGIKQTTISKIETGKWNFSIDFLTVIVKNLDGNIFLIGKR
jgi:transcriptional regulator with XRE-family HTH domain